MDPQTQGERIRYARIASELTQAQLAKAISLHGGRKASKSLVSQWENDVVRNPENANLFALQAVTGFRAQWLMSGEGEKRVSLRPTDDPVRLDRARLQRAIEAASAAMDLSTADTDRLADITGRLYDTLTVTPDINAPTLALIASALARP